MVDSRLGKGAKEGICPDEADAMSGPDGGIAEGLCQKGLANTDRTYKNDMFMATEEIQREGGIQ